MDRKATWINGESMTKNLEIAKTETRSSLMVIQCRIGTFLIIDEKDELEKLFKNVNYPILSAILEADLKTRSKYLTG